MNRLLAWVWIPLVVAACGGDAGPAADRAVESSPGVEAAATRGAPEAVDARPTVVFLGTSLTAGYGLGADRAYPARIQEKIDSAGLGYRVVNAGVSGETSAGGLRRVPWVLREPVDVLVLELGANDGLRGLDPDAMKRNLQAIVDSTRARYPEARVVIAGMRAPTNLGPRYTERFRAVFEELARENDAALVPFLLEGVALDPALNQADGIHPNEAGARVVAETVWEVLGPVLDDSD